MSNCVIRPAVWKDVAILRDIDLKCFDEPWEEGYWLYWFQDDRMVLLAEVGGKPAGMLAGALMEDGLAIEKVCVKKPYRFAGISRVLLDACKDITTKCPDKPLIHLAIPEPWLYPDSPNCIADWIRAVGFKARLPYLPSYFSINCVEMDGIRCELEVD